MYPFCVDNAALFLGVSLLLIYSTCSSPSSPSCVSSRTLHISRPGDFALLIGPPLPCLSINYQDAQQIISTMQTQNNAQTTSQSDNRVILSFTACGRLQTEQIYAMGNITAAAFPPSIDLATFLLLDVSVPSIPCW